MSYSFTDISCCGIFINLFSKFVIICLPFIVTSQDLSDRKPIHYVEYDKTFQFEKGIYCSFDEFQNNNPTIRNDFSIMKKESIEFFLSLESKELIQYYPFQNEKISFVNKVGDTVTFFLKSIWGFSDSEDVYFFKNKKIFKLKQIDVLSEVELWDKKYFFMSKPSSNSEIDRSWDYNMTGSRYTSNFEQATFDILGPRLNGYFLNLKSDSLFTKSQFCDQVENIIVEDSVIFHQYQNDQIKYKKEIYKAYRYYLLYCEKHPVYFPDSNNK